MFSDSDSPDIDSSDTIYDPDGLKQLWQIIKNFVDSSGQRFLWGGKVSERAVEKYLGLPNAYLSDILRQRKDYMKIETIKKLSGKIPKPDGCLKDEPQEYFSGVELEQIARQLQFPPYTIKEWAEISKQDSNLPYPEARALILGAIAPKDPDDVADAIPDIDGLLNGDRPEQARLLELVYKFSQANPTIDRPDLLRRLTLAYDYSLESAPESKVQKPENQTNGKTNGKSKVADAEV